MIDFVRLQDMQSEFVLYKSWSDLNSKTSPLVQFLISNCKYEGELIDMYKVGTNQIILDELKLKNLGLMLCKATNAGNRVYEMFDVIQEGGKNYISIKDKELRAYFNQVLDFEIAIV